MSKTLFNEFESVSSKAWKQKIQVDLKGADYNDTLIWKSNEGIDVKPIYHSDDFEGFPDTSGTKATTWKISQEINVSKESEANKQALDAISRGAEHITFRLHSENINVETLLNDIDLTKTGVSFRMTFLSSSFVKQNSAVTSSGIRIHLEHDIIGNLAKTGNWFNNLKEDQIQFEKIVKSSFQIFIDSSLYQNAGATMVQQLAYSLAHLNEYLNNLDTTLTDEEKSLLEITFNVAVGSNYFFEIAKLRALRLLFQTLAKEYGITKECGIFAIPSKRNKTIYDYNVNMLRTTTECMSAILGGANVVTNLPYDSLYHKPNEFGDRISRNQLLVLKNESYFDKVDNPADGSYYIESLTNQLAVKALDLFKDIESNGGFLHQLKEGTIQRKIKESAAKEQADFDAEDIVLLGTNRHLNPDDKMKDDLEIHPFLKVNKRKTLIEPIIERRLAEKLEQNRLKDE